MTLCTNQKRNNCIISEILFIFRWWPYHFRRLKKFRDFNENPKKDHVYGDVLYDLSILYSQLLCTANLKTNQILLNSQKTEHHSHYTEHQFFTTASFDTTQNILCLSKETILMIQVSQKIPGVLSYYERFNATVDWYRVHVKSLLDNPYPA